MERLRERSAGRDARLGEPGTLAFAELRQRVALTRAVEVGRLHLGGVRLERRQLSGEVRFVDDLVVVDLVGLEQQQRVGSVGCDPVDELLGVEERVASGDDAVDAQLAGSPVVGMQAVALPRVVAEHHVGAQPADHRTHLAAHRPARIELTVDVAEEDHSRAAQQGRGGTLLVLALLDQPRDVHRAVPRALRAVGQHQVVHGAALACPLGQRGSRLELRVVGMGDDHERGVRDRQVPRGRGGCRIGHDAAPGSGSGVARAAGCRAVVGSRRWARQGAQVRRHVQVVGLVDVPPQVLGAHDTHRQPAPCRLVAVALERALAVGDAEPRTRRHRHHVAATATSVGHDHRLIGCGVRESGEVGGEGQVAVGDDDTRDARSGASGDRLLHRAVEAQAGGPLDPCSDRTCPVTHLGVVAHAPHGQGCRRGDDPAGHGTGEPRPLGRVEHAGQTELGPGEGLHRDQHGGRGGGGHGRRVYGPAAVAADRSARCRDVGHASSGGPRLRPMRIRVAVIGGGSWGTTVAHLAAHQVPTLLWARRPELADEINSTHVNQRYLPGLELHPELRATSDLVEAVHSADVVVMGVPSQGFRSALEQVAEHLRAWVPVLSLTKGLEQGTQLRMTQVINQTLPGHPAAVLTGPNLAREILEGNAAAAVVATPDPVVAEYLQQIFHMNLFRVYTNPDVAGCEIAGALKNVIAIAAGMADGLGTGDNTKAMVITRGLDELSRLGEAMGGQFATFSGLAGMGDLLATCMSPHSRNRHVGEQLGGAAPSARSSTR